MRHIHIHLIHALVKKLIEHIKQGSSRSILIREKDNEIRTTSRGFRFKDMKSELANLKQNY